MSTSFDQTSVHNQAFTELRTRLQTGSIDRRSFLAGAAALGISAAAASVLANPGGVAAQAGTPAATPAGTPGATPVIDASSIHPTVGTENQTRGQGGELRIIWWQAPSYLNPHANGDAAASLTLEPLLEYVPGEQIGPVLVTEVPTIENGLLAEDLSTVTFKLREGLLWSDATPVTANDVVFTWQWITNPANVSTSSELWKNVASVEATDDTTALVTFTTPVINWFEAFTGWLNGAILPAHAFGNDPNNKGDEFGLSPIGTGPFTVTGFTPNDQVLFEANQNYREANKPYFSTVLFKGGGDALSAGRSVVQTGDFDFAWNVQAEPEVIQELRDSGTYGQIVETTGTTLESIYLNFSDPNQEVDGQRSQKDTPHPFLTDPAVRQALNLLIQRDLIAGNFYGSPDLATANQFTGLEFFESPNTSWAYDPAQATQILDEAGWTLDGDVRKKDGVELSLTYAASVNPVRQKTQAVVKQDLENAGFKVELVNVDSTIFFDAAAGNDQNLNHFYWDIAMWSSGGPSSIPVVWSANWYAGPDGSGIAQASNNWQAPNVQRYNNPEYDALYEQLLKVTTLEEAAQTLIGMNDALINDVGIIPLLIRSFYTAINNRLRYENIAFESAFVDYFWNIANWNEAPAE